MAVGGLTIGQGRGNRITIKDMEAIERIKGYCCEVTQAQWKELVKVADEVGCDVGPVSRRCRPDRIDKYARIDLLFVSPCLGFYDDFPECQIIPYPDFLAKLKGEEKWEPKAGEMVEVEINGKWKSVKFVGYNDATIVWFDPFGQAKYREAASCRPIRPTITRAEAESLLNKRIID
jgi:hypothetical protein